MQAHVTPAASPYRPETDGAALLAAALHAVVDSRPLPAALRPAPSAVPRPATVEEGYAGVLRTTAPSVALRPSGRPRIPPTPTPNASPPPAPPP